MMWIYVSECVLFGVACPCAFSEHTRNAPCTCRVGGESECGRVGGTLDAETERYTQPPPHTTHPQRSPRAHRSSGAARVKRGEAEGIPHLARRRRMNRDADALLNERAEIARAPGRLIVLLATSRFSRFCRMSTASSRSARNSCPNPPNVSTSKQIVRQPEARARA